MSHVVVAQHESDNWDIVRSECKSQHVRLPSRNTLKGLLQHRSDEQCNHLHPHNDDDEAKVANIETVICARIRFQDWLIACHQESSNTIRDSQQTCLWNAIAPVGSTVYQYSITTYRQDDRAVVTVAEQLGVSVKQRDFARRVCPLLIELVCHCMAAMKILSFCMTKCVRRVVRHSVTRWWMQCYTKENLSPMSMTCSDILACAERFIKFQRLTPLSVMVRGCDTQQQQQQNINAALEVDVHRCASVFAQMASKARSVVSLLSDVVVMTGRSDDCSLGVVCVSKTQCPQQRMHPPQLKKEDVVIGSEIELENGPRSSVSCASKAAVVAISTTPTQTECSNNQLPNPLVECNGSKGFAKVCSSSMTIEQHALYTRLIRAHSQRIPGQARPLAFAIVHAPVTEAVAAWDAFLKCETSDQVHSCQSQLQTAKACTAALQTWVDTTFPTRDSQASHACVQACRAVNNYVLVHEQATLVCNQTFWPVVPPRLARMQKELLAVVEQRCRSLWRTQNRQLLSFSLRRLMRLMGWIVEECAIFTMDALISTMMRTVHSRKTAVTQCVVLHDNNADEMLLQRWLEMHVKRRYNGAPYSLYLHNVKHSLHMMMFLAIGLTSDAPADDSRHAMPTTRFTFTFDFERQLWPMTITGKHSPAALMPYTIETDIHAAGQTRLSWSLQCFGKLHGCMQLLQTIAERTWVRQGKSVKLLSVTTYRATMWRIGFAIRLLCPAMNSTTTTMEAICSSDPDAFGPNLCECTQTVTAHDIYTALVDLHLQHMDPITGAPPFCPRRPLNTPKAASAQKVMQAMNLLLLHTDPPLYPNAKKDAPLHWAVVLEMVCAKCRQLSAVVSGPSVSMDRTMTYAPQLDDEREHDDMQRAYGWQETMDANELGTIGRRDHLDDDDVERVRVCLRDVTMWAQNSSARVKARLLFEIALSTGMRRGEIARLRHASIVHVETGNIPTLSSVQQKGGHTRLFVSTPQMADACLEYLRHPAYNQIVQTGEYLFPARQLASRTIRHVGSNSIGRAITQLLLKAGVDRHQAHAHAIRKTVVVRLWRAGNSLVDISKFLCHANVNTTYKHYLDVSYTELASSLKQSSGSSITDNIEMRSVEPSATTSACPPLANVEVPATQPVVQSPFEHMSLEDLKLLRVALAAMH